MSLDALKAWQPPSLKKMDRLPGIELAGNGFIAYYTWFYEHPEINRAVPPVYPDFTIRYHRGPPDLREPHDYTVCVHYAEDLTAFAACHVRDGKKILTAFCDYTDMRAQISAPDNLPFSPDWIEREGRDVVQIVLAVQAYILYHQPQIVEKVLTEPPRERKRTDRKPADRPTGHIGQTRTHYIRLSETIPKERNVNYRAIQWTVRGHYRHITKQGKPTLVYIAPHLAKRGEKKLKGKITTVDPPEPEGGN